MRNRGVAVVLMTLLACPGVGGAETRQVPVAPGAFLNVIVTGAGPAAVFIPGLFGSAYGYRKLVGPLTDAGYRVILVEPLGIGRSSRPEGADYSLTAQADRIANVLDVLDANQAVVVAHSVGASIALRLAYRHPDHVAAIVSLDGGPAEAAATRGFRRAMRFAPLIKLFGGKRIIRGHVRSTLVTRSADPRWVTDDVVDGYMGVAAQDLDGALGVYRQMARAQEPEELRPHLGDVRCPVRLVMGTATREGGVSEAEIELLRERLASFAVETVPDAGNFVYEEKPLAVVAAVERALGSARLQAAAVLPAPVVESRR
jgi:4,5:9,10-diseco-3-hydroxy-5,9,17-trioxoandrosta-1(10),2-diene-4-oate hydrolase